PSKIEVAITKKTKAIMPVSLYGQCADMDAINQVARNHDLPVIEDAAQSFGATYKGKKSGALSTIGSTSFFPSKTLGCYGDGGACFTNDDELATRMRWIRTHGQDRRYHHAVLGVNSRLDTLQAAILLAKFEIFLDEVVARAKIGRRYSEELNRAVGDRVITPYIEARNTSVYAQYTVQVSGRDSFQKAVEAKGVPTAVHYPIPLHLQPAFNYLNQGEGSFYVSEQVSKRVISLPMHPYLTDEVQDRVVKVMCEVALN
ncbi:MAG: DegT/DnrJ/EryC1/StrS family aminotransferase, partial [Bdellovibrionota bacterium]